MKGKEMTGILKFETDYGDVLIEVDEETASAASRDQTARDEGLTPKSGVVPLTAKSPGTIAGKANKKLGDAMSIVKSYASTVQDVVGGLKVTPKEVSVEIGLKLKGEAGFIIAKAGTEAEMKIALTWEPAPKAPKTG